MVCTTKQEHISIIEIPNSIDSRKVRKPVWIIEEDEESRKLRKHLAQQKAIRLMEQRKAVVHMRSYLR